MKSAQIGAAVLPPASPVPSFLHVVEADPDRGQQVGREADEPGVALAVRRAGLARRGRRSFAGDRAVRGPLVDHAAHERVIT